MSETIDTLFDLSVLLQMSENLMGAGLHPAPVVFLGGCWVPWRTRSERNQREDEHGVLVELQGDPPLGDNEAGGEVLQVRVADDLSKR